MIKVEKQQFIKDLKEKLGHLKRIKEIKFAEKRLKLPPIPDGLEKVIDNELELEKKEY